jgi:secreted PhoX family phosphatase
MIRRYPLFTLPATAAVLATVASALLPACSSPSVDTRFTEVSPAQTDGEKRAVRASESVTLGGKRADIGFVTLLRSGEQRGDSEQLNVFGQVLDQTQTPIVQTDGSTTIADSNDFSSILQVGSKLFSVSQFESRPGTMYLTALAQDPSSGRLSAETTTALDLSGIYGIWNPCAGSVTPWNTHLGSEEYEPDARDGDAAAEAMAPFFGGDTSKVQAYRYGYPVEVRVTDTSGAHSVVKHYSMGRFAHELSYVMPDERTVYGTDDGTNVGLFMYVADTASDLSAGSLYAMKWHQTTPAGESDLVDADLSWIKLGHASDAEIDALIADGIQFSDIFATVEPAADGTCPGAYTPVNANGIGEECLKLNAGMEQAAAFLETRRYAGYLGATTELRKEEGISFDPRSGQLYIAFSEVQYGMEDNRKNGVDSSAYDAGTTNDVKALFNSCGAVYRLAVGEDAEIGSPFVAQSAHGVIAGRMTTVADPERLNPTTIDAYPSDSPFANSSCEIDGLANPDNVSVMPGQNMLLIGEDTGSGHQNDAIWAYRTDNGQLTRIATTPYGAETTSVYYYPDVASFGYIMAVVQHPYGESDEDKVTDDSAERRSYLGYIGALPPHR